MRKYLVAVLAAMAVALGAPPVSAAEVVTAAQIEAARTPADHEAIAKAYDGAATEADKEAADHMAMEKVYRGGSHKGSTTSIVNHCKRLSAAYKSAATEYRALAAEHRKMAAAAQK